VRCMLQVDCLLQCAAGFPLHFKCRKCRLPRFRATFPTELAAAAHARVWALGCARAYASSCVELLCAPRRGVVHGHMLCCSASVI
jgi:hypothetical protein